MLTIGAAGCSPKGNGSDQGWPRYLLEHGGNLVVSRLQEHRIDVLDPADRKVLHVLEMGEHQVTETRHDGNTPYEQQRTIQHAPGTMVIAAGRLFVEEGFSDHLSVYDVSNWQKVGQIQISGEGALCTSPDRQRVYFASNKKNECYEIDPVSLDVLRCFKYPANGRGCLTCAVSPDGKRLYLGIQRGLPPDMRSDSTDKLAEPWHLGQGWAGYVAVFDLAAETYVAAAPLGKMDDSSACDMLFSPDGKTLYIGMFQSLAGIWLYDTGEDRVRACITLPGSVPHSPPSAAMALAWCDGKLLCLSRPGGLIVIDEQTGRIDRQIAVESTDRGHWGLVALGDQIVVYGDHLQYFPLSRVLGR